VSELTYQEWAVLLSAKNGKARCPAHDDRYASLSVSAGKNGETLLHCHAGCAPEAVVAAVGKAMADLFTKEGTTAKSYNVVTTRPLASYSYMDTSGKVQLEKRRFPCSEAGKKHFRWYHVDANRRWQTGRNGLTPALYRIHEAKEISSILWAEGEKDTDALVNHGVWAVCAPDGAGGEVTLEQLEPLRGKDITILPDNDTPGKKHGQTVAGMLQGIAASVKILDLKKIVPDLPEKGDISDVFGKLGDDALAKLDELREATPEWSTEVAEGACSLVSLDQIKPEPPQYAWEPYLRLFNINDVRGDGGTGKTMFLKKNEEGAYVCHVAGQEGELIFQSEGEYKMHFDGDVLFVRFENYGKIWTATE